MHLFSMFEIGTIFNVNLEFPLSTQVSVVQELDGARRLLSKALSRVEQRGQGEETKMTNKEDIAKVAKTVKQMMEAVERKLEN